jgi:hypothetical protein
MDCDTDSVQKKSRQRQRDIAWWAHERGARCGRTRSAPYAVDLNALFSIPKRVLRKGFGEAGQE